MRNLRHALALSSLLALPQLAAAVACSDQPAVKPLPIRTTPVPPLAPGLAGRPAPLAAPHVLLSDSRDESLSLDHVLLRLHLESCTRDTYAGYKPRTEFDNTPWRFNSKPGTKFSAAEFDAWMKSRGVRVAKGNAASAAATDDTATPAAVEE
jgi:hypothetical protein